MERRMSKVLLAVVTCGDPKFKERADVQREVWVPKVVGADVRFFLAKQDREPLPDEVFLDVPDDYKSLPTKVRAMQQWAVANGYQKVCKLDDDTLVMPERMLASIPEQDYAGYLNGTPPKPWCSGFCYWLSEKAMKIVAEAPIPPEEWAEDRWVGGVLHGHGIKPHWDRRYCLIIPKWAVPNLKTAVAVCDCTGDNYHPGGKPRTLQELQAMCL
jgi:hypothetical protein